MPLRLILAIAAIVVLVSSVFFVDQREKVLLLQVGKIKQANVEPGWQWKIPFLEEVKRFDGRILTFDAKPSRYLTGEKKNVIVDSFVLWRISDVATYYTSMSGDEERAKLRLSQIVKDGLRAEFGQRTIQQVVSDDRRAMVAGIIINANEDLNKFGIEVLDVRIKRIDLPTKVSDSVYRRMESERERVAKELRSQGAEAAEKIRSDADRQRTVILAAANQKSEEIRGSGEAQATKVYAEAYGKNEDFYALYRRLTAYQKVFSGNDTLVLDPSGDFFKKFADPTAN